MSKVNTIEYGIILQNSLDKKIVPSLKTGWMDSNAGQVKYEGGKEIKIPVMSTSGMGNYGREDGSGYVNGSIQLAWKTYTMTQDRGRSFTLDRHDVDESAFVANATNVMGVFQNEHVVPEIDAYRLSKLINNAITLNEGVGNAKFSCTITKANVIDELKDAIGVLRDKGYNGQIVIHCTGAVKRELEKAMATQLRDKTFKVGGVDTTIPTFDGCILIETPSNYMVSAIELQDGKTLGQEAGGFKKGSLAKNCNFLVVAQNVPIAVTKQDKMKIFDPDTYQGADSWFMAYRRYHDLFILENKKDLMFANMVDAKA